tara:strand:- start:288 stop:887 length:600 start_codon:yes stop_codon:yes gene_type:complete
MSQLKLTADSGGGTVAIKGPASTTGNAALDLTVPGTASATLDTLGRAGNILQVKQTVKLDPFSTTSTSLVDVTGLSVSITPSTTSNKVLVRCSVAIANYSGNFAYGQLVRGSTFLGEANAAGNRVRPTFMFYQDHDTTINMQNYEFLDSPNTTSATTYKLQLRCATTGYAYVNRTYTDGNGVNTEPRLSSTITVMEVAA